MSANGRLTAAELTTVAPGLQLANHAANSYERMVAAALAHGWTITIALPYGAYRSYAVQDGMHHAGSSAGTAAERRKYGLNPYSTVSIASAGLSSHGFGTRADLLFNGAMPNAAQIAFAATFGWTREFGAADPNHFMHDGVTAITPITKDPDMVSTDGSYTYTYKTPLKLSTTDWKTVSIDAKANSSFVTDFDGIVLVSVATRLHGLPVGQTVQGRLQIVTVEDGKVTKAAYSDVIELQGSDGDSFPAFTDGVSIHKNQRLRLVLLAQTEGVTVIRTACTVLRFQRS